MEVRRLRPSEGAAKAIVDVVTRVKHLETRPSGTIYIDDKIVARDPSTGNEIIIGEQPDGSWGIDPNVNDITPPGKPSTPTVTGAMGGLEVWWDGKENGGTPQPSDYSHTDIEYSKTGTSVWTLGGTFTNANGTVIGNLSVGETYRIRLISYDKNKNASDPSTVVSGVPVSYVDNEDVENALEELRQSDRDNAAAAYKAQETAGAAHDTATSAGDAALRAAGIANGKGRVIYADTAPTAEEDRNVNNLWIDTSGLIPKNTPHRWDTTTKKWVVITDKVALDAGIAAGNAEQIANAASATAAAAAAAAGQAQTAANSKNRVWYLPTAPTGNDHKVGDTWFDTANGNMIKRWTGTEWVSAQDAAIAVADGKAAAAASAASAAGTTAGNAATAADNAAKAAGAKGKVIIQSAAPDAADRLPQNLWIDTTGGANTPKRWSGQAWVAVTDKKATDAADAAVVAKDRADEAFNVATSAAETAGLAQESANGKNRVWYSTTAPTGTSHRLNDLWFDEANGNKPMRWNGSAWVTAQDAAIAIADKKAADAASTASAAGSTATNAATAADNAAKAAGAKGKVIIQSAAPDVADRLPQNLWIDTTGGANTPKRWVSGTTWAAVTDKKAVDAADAAATAQGRADDAFIAATSAAEAAGLAQESADGKNKVWYSTTAPTGTLHRVNDLWFDEANGNKPMRWNGSAWVSTQDQIWSGINDKVEKVTTSANGKNSIYYAATAPVSTTTKPLVIGDTWFDTANGNRIKVWSGSPAKWTDAVDRLLTETSDAVTEARRVADGKSAIYYETSAPVSTTLRPLVKGDTWFNTSKNYQMSTWSGTAWQITQDSKAALDAANGKNKVSTGATAPVSPAVGDTWIDTANGNVIKVYTGTTGGWTSYQDKAIDVAQKAAEGAQSSANGKNNNVYDLAAPTTAQGTGRTVGDTWFRIDNNGAVYAQWTWNGTKWDPVALRHEVIASIDAGKISTGTMDARFITANTITTDQMMVGFGTNLIPNPGFELGIEPHRAVSPSTAALYGANAVSGSKTVISQNSAVATWANVFDISSGAKSATGLARTFDIKTSADYVLSFSAKFSGTAVAGQQVRGAVYFYDGANAYLASRGGPSLALTWDWTKCEFIIERTAIPAGAVSASLFLQTDKGGAVQHDDWFFGEKINGSLLVKGSITADLGILGEAVVGTAQITELGVTTGKIANLAVTDAKISTLNAGKINAGELDAARIGAKTITVDKLLVSSTDNLVQDADFSDPKGVSWGGYSGAYSWSATEGRNGGPALKITLSTSQQGKYNNPVVPATGGSSYRVLAWVKSTMAAPINSVAIYVRQRYLGSSSSYASQAFSNSEIIPANTWYPLTGIMKTRDDTTGISFGIYTQGTLSSGTFWADYLSATRASDGQLIVDGSITSTSITTDGLNAGVIKFGEMDGGLIKADSITSKKLAITDLTNFAPSLAGAGSTEWELAGGMAIINTTTTAEGKRFDAVAPTSTAWALGPLKEVSVGEKLFASAKSYRSGAHNHYLRYYYYDKSKTLLAAYDTAPGAVGSITSWTLTATVPAGAAYAQLRLALTGTGSGGMYDVRGYKQAPATLIEDGAITTDHMKVGTIDGKVIKAYTISGTEIMAKTISTDNLLITSTDNLIQEADFAAKGLGWGDLTTTAIVATGGRNGGPVMRFTAATGTQTVYNKYTAAVEPGSSYRLVAWIKPSVAMAKGHFAVIATSTPAVSGLSVNNDAIAAGAWGKISGIIKVPDNSTSMKFGLQLGTGFTSGTVDVDFVSVTRASDGNLIVDGAVTTDSMIAGTIDGKVIKAKTISAAEIMSKTITVDNMLISSTDNFIHEADFSNKGTGWQSTAAWTVTNGVGRNGGPAMVVANTASAQALYNLPQEIPMEAAQVIRVSAWVKTSVAAAANTVRIGVRAKGPTGANTLAGLRYDHPDPIAANTWTRVKGMIKLPGDTVTVSFYIESGVPSGTTTWDYVSATRAAGAELIVDGSITTDSITSGGIDASVIKAGTIDAARIGAQSISAEKLVIGQGANLIADPMFLDDTSNAIRASRSTGTWTFPVDTGTSLSSARCNIPATLSTGSTYFYTSHYPRSAANASKMIPCSPGDKFQFECSIYTNVSVPVRMFADVVFADGTSSTNTAGQAFSTAAGRRPYSKEWTAPVGCVAFSPVVQLTNSAVATTFIIDGGISAVKKVWGELIIDGALTGKTITGALIQSVDTAARGIKMNDTEFVAYNNSGVETLRLSGNTAIITGATVRTAASGARVQMDATGLHAYPASGGAYLSATSRGLELTGTLKTVGTSTEAPGTISTIVGPTPTGGGIGSSRTVPGIGFYNSLRQSTTDAPPSISSQDGEVLRLAGQQTIYENRAAVVSLGSDSNIVLEGNVIVTGTLRQNEPNGRHMEFNGSTSIPSGTETLIGTMAIDAAKSPRANAGSGGNISCATWSANGTIKLTESGVFQVDVKADMTASGGNLSYVVIYEDGWPAQVSYLPSGATLGTVSGQFLATTGTTLQIKMYQSRGSAVTTAFRVKVTSIT